MTISIPALSGAVHFDTTWYPPEGDEANAYGFSFVTSHADGSNRRVRAGGCNEHYPGYEAPLRFTPTMTIRALDSITTFEIYVTPYILKGPERAAAAPQAPSG
jgi:hypothetical protein